MRCQAEMMIPRKNPKRTRAKRIKTMMCLHQEMFHLVKNHLKLILLLLNLKKMIVAKMILMWRQCKLRG